MDVYHPDFYRLIAATQPPPAAEPPRRPKGEAGEPDAAAPFDDPAMTALTPPGHSRGYAGG